VEVTESKEPLPTAIEQGVGYHEGETCEKTLEVEDMWEVAPEYAGLVQHHGAEHQRQGLLVLGWEASKWVVVPRRWCSPLPRILYGRVGCHQLLGRLLRQEGLLWRVRRQGRRCRSWTGPHLDGAGPRVAKGGPGGERGTTT